MDFVSLLSNFQSVRADLWAVSVTGAMGRKLVTGLVMVMVLVGHILTEIPGSKCNMILVINESAMVLVLLSISVHWHR